METVLLNTRSSIEAWQRGFANNARLLEHGHTITCVGNAKTLKTLSNAVPDLCMPITIAVEDSGKRCESNGWKCQVWSKPFPPSSVYRMNEQGVCLSAPWFCYLQMAPTLNLADGIRLGMELCGTHSTLPFTPGIARTFELSEREIHNGFVDTHPVMTSKQLQAFLSAMGLGRQSKSVIAARFVIDGSRSPGESRLYIVLCLPTRLGGYALPKPLLNYRIDIPRHLWEAAGTDRYYVDFFYPGEMYAGITQAVEFDGGYHWQGNQRMRDNVRQILLEEMGIHVMRIDKLQLQNMEVMDLQAQRLADALGVRLRQPTPSVLCARKKLFKQALDWHSSLYQ